MNERDIGPARLRTRREALALIGVSGAALLGARMTAHAAAGASLAPSCIARPQQTEGPFFVDETLNRSDIRSDPRGGALMAGVPIKLAFSVSSLSGASCAPLAGAQVDIWQCDATGRYSAVEDRRSTGRSAPFLRGYQQTDDGGNARFVTVYPGGYAGRAVHIHFKIRTATLAAKRYEFTSQLYFDDALTDRVHAKPPYAGRGRAVRNDDDFIFRDGGRQLLLAMTPDADGYAASFDIGLKLG